MNEDNSVKQPVPASNQAIDNNLSQNIPDEENVALPQNTTSIPIPPEAEDSDLIEKEWVERAKQIVDHTRHDPHEQQKALSLMKADYMKKRYNRDVKVSERDLKDLKSDAEDN
jgi:hypothetical protein